MPSTMMLSDSMFPRFTDETSQGEKIEVIYNYLHQLLEQLRYTLGNLEADNFNDSALDKLSTDITAELDSEVKVIRTELVGINGTLYGTASGDGIITRLKSAEGSVATLTLTAAQLKTAMSDDEGNIMSLSATASAIRSEFATADKSLQSSFTQTVAGFEASITANENAITQLQADAGGIKTQVTNLETTAGTLEGDVTNLKTSVSTIEQNAESIELKVAKIEGNIDDIEDAAVDAAEAKIEAFVDEITLSVATKDSVSTITLKSGSTEISSGEIDLSGMVTFSSLEDGEETTTINGAEISLYFDTDDYENSLLAFYAGSNVEKIGDIVALGTSTYALQINTYVYPKTYSSSYPTHFYVDSSGEIGMQSASETYFYAYGGDTRIYLYSDSVTIKVGDVTWEFTEDTISTNGNPVVWSDYK